jgi:hypothetical protein
MARESYAEEAAAVGPLDPDDEGPEFLHLRDARMVLSGASVAFGGAGRWRGALADVSLWTLGGVAE